MYDHDYFIKRISVIFRVRSAKAVKITDIDLIKRLGAIVGMFILFLIVRTLVSPPKGKLSWLVTSLIIDFCDPSYNRGDCGQSQGIFVWEQLVGPCLHNKYVMLTRRELHQQLFPELFFNKKIELWNSVVHNMNEAKWAKQGFHSSLLLIALGRGVFTQNVKCGFIFQWNWWSSFGESGFA